MRFVPVNLSQTNCTIWQTDGSNAFQFPPATPSIHSLQAIKFTNGMPDCDSFYICDFADDFNFGLHGGFISSNLSVKSPPNFRSGSGFKETFHCLQQIGTRILDGFTLTNHIHFGASGDKPIIVTLNNRGKLQ